MGHAIAGSLGDCLMSMGAKLGSGATAGMGAGASTFAMAMAMGGVVAPRSFPWDPLPPPLPVPGQGSGASAKNVATASAEISLPVVMKATGTLEPTVAVKSAKATKAGGEGAGKPMKTAGVKDVGSMAVADTSPVVKDEGVVGCVADGVVVAMPGAVVLKDVAVVSAPRSWAKADVAAAGVVQETAAVVVPAASAEIASAAAVVEALVETPKMSMATKTVMQAEAAVTAPVGAVLQGSVGRVVAKGTSDVSAGVVTKAVAASEVGELKVHGLEASAPNRLEVGVQGGTAGWMKVRAEIGANGDVSATLKGFSAGTTQMLQAQAPRIENWLSAQSVVVRSVRVETSGAGLESAMSGGRSQQESSRQGWGSGVVDESDGDEVESLSAGYWMQGVGTGSWLNVRV